MIRQPICSMKCHLTKTSAVRSVGWYCIDHDGESSKAHWRNKEKKCIKCRFPLWSETESQSRSSGILQHYVSLVWAGVCIRSVTNYLPFLGIFESLEICCQVQGTLWIWFQFKFVAGMVTKTWLNYKLYHWDSELIFPWNRSCLFASKSGCNIVWPDFS